MPVMSAAMIAEAPQEIRGAIDALEASKIPVTLCGQAHSLHGAHSASIDAATMTSGHAMAMGPVSSGLAGVNTVVCLVMSADAFRKGDHATAVRMAAMGGRDGAMLTSALAHAAQVAVAMNAGMVLIPVFGAIAGAAGLWADAKALLCERSAGLAVALLGDVLLLGGSVAAVAHSAEGAVAASVGMAVTAVGLAIEWGFNRLHRRRSSSEDRSSIAPARQEPTP
jgi:hypothetical protein